jgi:tetratricopeptide (TPR) repeat protein
LILAGINGITSDRANKKNNDALKVYETGNAEEAINKMKEAVTSAVSMNDKRNALMNLAYIYASETQDDLALSAFKEALTKSYADSFDRDLITGEIALLENKPEEAESAFNKAYKKDPNSFQINNALALFYLNLDEKADKFVDYEKALQFAKKTDELSKLKATKQNLGIAYFFNKKFPEAIAVLSKIDTNSDPYAAYWLGLSYLGNEEGEQAKSYLQKAIDGGVSVPDEITEIITEP